MWAALLILAACTGAASATAPFSRIPSAPTTLSALRLATGGAQQRPHPSTPTTPRSRLRGGGLQEAVGDFLTEQDAEGLSSADAAAVSVLRGMEAKTVALEDAVRMMDNRLLDIDDYLANLNIEEQVCDTVARAEVVLRQRIDERLAKCSGGASEGMGGKLDDDKSTKTTQCPESEPCSINDKVFALGAQLSERLSRGVSALEAHLSAQLGKLGSELNKRLAGDASPQVDKTNRTGSLASHSEQLSDIETSPERLHTAVTPPPNPVPHRGEVGEVGEGGVPP
eukprot:CAMPEP_0206253676 /NCGR_PEP_ID=MMETSP0047_2-20121206/23281_1 /ASSEMBLY_ACC=CAM_ASM_000192 /TAXON_ID=195065 /ORGANISM="Chroomonas mesostigmatica_cf, Strain CCMP1168" /LENGTH=281 /DNA_ID=CAMNT_0053679905 /DNA_START=128 /DNA_END=969 /DNA_ORIENTATION=+